MPGCPTHTKPILFLWRFDGDGNPTMDARIDIKADPKAVSSAHMMELRMRYNSDTKMALFHIQPEMTVENIEQYLESAAIPEMRAEVMKKLKGAEVSLRSILGEESKSSAVNFIHDLANEGCTCPSRGKTHGEEE